MAKKTIHIMNTAFRDGFQSVYGARVLTEDFMPAVKVCAEAGQTHFEAAGAHDSKRRSFIAMKVRSI